MKIDSLKVNNEECLSGSFITSVESKNEIAISQNEDKITIIFNFNKEKKEKLISPKFEGGGKGKELKIFLELPFLENDSQGIVRPLPIAYLDDGTPVELQLWLRKMSEPYVEVVYSFYIKNKNACK